MPLKDRRQSTKHVRLSMDAKIFQLQNSGQSSRHSIISEKTKNMRKINEDQESLADYIERTSSTRSSFTSTSSNKTVQNLPQFLLEHLDDEKMLMKHTTHTIEIDIINLEFCHNSSLLENDEANFLYVEYSFLNYKGYLLETQSLPKPKKAGDSIHYNLIRKFDISPVNNKNEYKMLKSMLEKNSKKPLKFLIVSEPISVEKDDDGDCEEVG